jgi:hypothetical protein
MNFTINVGLLNNPYASNIKEALATNGFSIMRSFYSVGEFEGSEPTLVAHVVTNANDIAELTAQMDNLCDVLTQQCIPVLLNDGKGIMFGKDADKYPFDSAYFLHMDVSMKMEGHMVEWTKPMVHCSTEKFVETLDFWKSIL